MSRRPDNEGLSPFRLEELEVTIEVSEGKLSAVSRSGPKGGTIEVNVDRPTTHLTLKGAGSDAATVKLSGPELSNFRSIIDATLSSLVEGETSSELERSSLFSGYRPLRRINGGYGVSFDKESLGHLGLLDADGELPGGSRQVQCTILPNGTAIVNLVDSQEMGFQF